jgi:hypothetical protein
VGDLVFGGTGTIGHLFVYEPATGISTDLGEAVQGQEKIGALAIGPDSLVYGGTGSNTNEAHLFRFDPSDPWQRTDLGIPIATAQDVAGLAILGDLVYGVTGSTHSLFTYDYQTNKITSLGALPEMNTVTGLTVGPDGRLYGGDYPSGQLWVYDPATGQAASLGQPVPGEVAVYAALAGPDNAIYGGTGYYSGQFFRYDIAAGTFETIGAPVWLDTRLYELILSSDGWIYGGTGGRRGHLFRFDPLHHPYASVGTATSISIGPRMQDKTYVPGTSEVWALAVGDDGKLYASGYSPSNPVRLSRWDPEAGGEMEFLGWVPGEPDVVYDLLQGPDGLIYGSGGGWYGPSFFSYDPASGVLEEIPSQLTTEDSINALARCPEGLIYGGTEGYDIDSGQIFSYDPSNGTFHYYGQAVAGEMSVFSLTCGTGNILYGGTYPSAHLFRFDAIDGFTDLGQPIPGETAVSAVARGPDGRVYGGTAGSGRFFVYDPASHEVTVLGQPFALDTGINQLEPSPDGLVFGVTGGVEGHLFAYDTGSQQLSDLGRVFFYERFTYGLALDATGQTAYLGTGYNYGEMLAYERNYGFGWLSLAYATNMPEDTEVAVDILDTAGNVLLARVPSGGSLLAISAAASPAIQLRAVLSTATQNLSPALLEWSVTWTEDPVMAVAPASLEFQAPAGGPNPVPQLLAVSNTSGGTLAWSLGGLPDWLAAEPASGTAPSTVTVTAQTEDLPTGLYTAALQFEGGAECVNCPVVVPVSLTVTPTWRVFLPLVQRNR